MIVGQDALLSTPAASCLIHKYKAVGGLIVTASTAHSGSSHYFGIKINGSGGGEDNISHIIILADPT